MKVKYNKQIEAEVLRLQAEQALDARMAAKVSSAVEQYPIVVDDGANLMIIPEDGDKIAYAFDVIATDYDVFANDGERDVTKPLVAKEGRVFHPGTFADNPYLQNVSFKGKDLGRWSLSQGFYEPFQMLSYDTPCWADSHYFTVPKLAYFEMPFVFPCFMEKGDVWMSITPNELFTMEKPIADAHGKVLTLGCGMGYYAYMAARKENVESVTIVEYESDVIELFKSVILPQLECADKITLIQADAYTFMEELEDGAYDYCFADVWIGAGSVHEYLSMRDSCSHLKQTEVSYWIEDSFLNYLLRLVSYEVIDAFATARGDEVTPRRIPENLQGAADYVHRLLADTVVPSNSAVRRLVNRDALLKLMNDSPVTYRA